MASAVSERRDWARLDDTAELQYQLLDLVEGRRYQLQVAAENSVGVGPFVQLPTAVVPKTQCSTCRKHCTLTS